MAEYLAKVQWGKEPIQSGEAESTTVEHDNSHDKIVQWDLEIDTGYITREELDYAIKKLRRARAPGPDHTPMEFFKELNDVNLDRISELFHEWWRAAEIPEDQLRARVARIFKNKGNSNDINNYRPISLTISLYKIFTAILPKRLEEK